jgi:putative membrane protein
MSPTLARPRASATALTLGPALGLILAAYASARVLEIVPNSLPHIAIVALDVLSALAFALAHGARHYGLRGILIFAGICILVGNFTENLSILTGFPFGHYYFAGLMGPKLFNVPVLLGLAYIGMAYVSWTLARLIVGGSLPGDQLLALPLTASFIMVAWDLAQDPVWGTALHGWIWRDGGPWFGVPISNYLGWYLNVFLIYLFFAAYLRRRPTPAVPHPQAHWRSAILFYIFCAAGNVLQRIPTPDPMVVADPTGAQWRVADITGASALVSIFVMGSFAAFAWVRLSGSEKSTTD